MGGPRQTISSASEEDPQYAMMDEKKRRRMLSNRESARRSRMKKQKLSEDLISEVSRLQNLNKEIKQTIDATTQGYRNFVSENNVLVAQKMELVDRLNSLNFILQNVQDVYGVPLDIPEIPDPLLKPWSLPCPLQPIPASSSMLQF
ncbi:hypothetical protein PVL29_017911 [Vitis rotundifolia]|uniref:BZIP domain-containing protein n=1 Tax=Vitis rotundifolia TaxID=103349 RepID=A0AA39DEA5_VITRO|nr:hypothetical protein PVL29_017911 [Vitis rotundifolia]